MVKSNFFFSAAPSARGIFYSHSWYMDFAWDPQDVFSNSYISQPFRPSSRAAEDFPASQPFMFEMLVLLKEGSEEVERRKPPIM